MSLSRRPKVKMLTLNLALKSAIYVVLFTIFVTIVWDSYQEHKKDLTGLVASNKAEKEFSLPTITICGIMYDQWSGMGSNITKVYNEQPRAEQLVLGYTLHKYLIFRHIFHLASFHDIFTASFTPIMPKDSLLSGNRTSSQMATPRCAQKWTLWHPWSISPPATE